MRPRGVSVLALAGLLSAGGLAFALRPRIGPALKTFPATSAGTKAPTPAPATPIASVALSAAPPAPLVASRFELLPAVRIENETTRESLKTKLYDASGQVDETAANQLDQLLCDARDPKHHETTRINRRTLQLLFKAAYHFASYDVQVVSAYRNPGRQSEGPHGTGAAIDFRLVSTSARDLAVYLRSIPRTGVGIYTHPKTQYVHLDSREHSFHWLDASPPRRQWREKSIGGANLADRDRRYTPDDDLPDGLHAPAPSAADAP